MKDLFSWLNNTEEHPLIKSSIFPYKLEFIYFFSDGNGRAGRLWQILVLASWRPVFKIYSLRRLFINIGRCIIKLLLLVEEKMVVHTIYRVYFRRNETLALESRTPCSTRNKIIDLLCNSPKIANNELASILCNLSEVLNITFKMTAKGVIIRHGCARGGCWEM